MPPPRVSLLALPPALSLLALLLAACVGPAEALDFAGIASMLASGYAQVNKQSAFADNGTSASGRSALEPQVIYGVPVTTPQPTASSDKPLSYSSILDALRRQDWAALSDVAGYGASAPLATTANPSESEAQVEDSSGGCGPDCSWTPAAAEADGSYRILYPVEDGVQEEPQQPPEPPAPDYDGSFTQRGPASTAETARAEPRFSPAGKHHPVFAAAAAASRPDPYSAGRPSSYQAPSRPPGPGPAAYDYAYPPYSNGGPPPPPPRQQPRPPPPPPMLPAPEPPKKMPTSVKGGPQKPAFLPYAPDYAGGDDYGSAPEPPNSDDQGYNYKPPSSGPVQGYNYPAPRPPMQSSNQGYDYPKPRPDMESSGGVQNNEPPKMSPPGKVKPMNYYGSSQSSDNHYFQHGDEDFSFDAQNGNDDDSPHDDLHGNYQGHHDFSFKPPKDEQATPQKDVHDHHYGHHDEEYTFNPGELPKPSDEGPHKLEKPERKPPMAPAPMGKPMVYNQPGKLPPPEDHDYSEADDSPPPQKPPSKQRPSNHHYYNSDDYEDHHKPHGDRPMPSSSHDDYDDHQKPPMKYSKPQAKPSPPEPQPPPPQIFYHKPSSHLGYHDDYEDDELHPAPPPKAPKAPMKPAAPEPPPPPPAMYHKPTANHAPHHDDYEYDYEEEHDHHTMPPPPKDEEQRVNKRPYSYYHLGRKLWYIPLYFSVYFIIYVTALIIKAIARHKIQYPLYYAGTSKDADHHSRRRRDETFVSSPGPFQAGLELIMSLATEVENALENGERLYKNR